MDEQLDLARMLEELREGIQDVQQAHEQDRDLLRSMAEDICDREDEVGRLEAQLDSQAATLAQARQEISAIATTVAETQGAFEAFLEQYGRHQIVANAQAELTQLTVLWKADFAQRRHTRSLTRGLVHTLTARAVQHEMVDTVTIDACVREQLLAEPTFWLAPAAMAVAARYKGDAVSVSRATGYAFLLDSAKAKLFFALTCSRLGHLSEAAGWMDRYLGSLDRDYLGPEFTVVLDAIANDELGHEAFIYAREAMARWFREDPAVFRAGHAPGRAHLERWKPRMWELSATAQAQRFDVLRGLCGDGWGTVEESWRSAMAVGGTLGHLNEEFSAEQPPPARKGRYAESALDHLIDQHEPDEAELHTRMERLRSLIKHEGDTEAAAATDEGPHDTERLDFATLLERAVFEPAQLTLGAPGRRLALTCVWESVRAATLAMAEQSRLLMPSTITLTVEDWSCKVPTDVAAPFDGAMATRELTEHLERRTRSYVDSVVPLWRLTLVCSVLAALDGLWLVPRLSGGGEVLFTALAVGLGCTALGGLVHVPFRRHSLREDGIRRRAKGIQDLTQALKELTHLLAEWRGGLASSNALDSLTPLGEGKE